MVRTLICLIPLFPLLSALLTLVLGPKLLKERSHWPTIVACLLSWVCSMGLLFSVGQLPDYSETVNLYTWAAVGGEYPLSIEMALHADSLAAIMLSMLTFVSSMVAIYASGYMHGDRGYFRFFTEVSLFVFSMIMLVLSANFVQMYMFWEGVGLCSYLLIGFWYEKPVAAAAGKKSFVVNRIGDFGFMTGVFFLWDAFGSVNFSDVLVQSRIETVNPTIISLACFCLFMGAVGKSAQFPLYVWLPDAMEGPTPVSALIHAATMVTAGVYMVVRCTPLFQMAPDTQIIVSFIGGFTALLAALIALTQNDLKRVLAYSTVSQLGYMFLALGTGTLMGIAGGMFHLVTHAFFKALLFLSAGSVMHAMGGVVDMREFSGLRRKMPQTATTFLIGSLALAGLFPLSGFWSKDTVLAAAWAAGHPEQHADEHAEAASEPHDAHAGLAAAVPSAEVLATRLKYAPLYRILFWMGTFTALLTAFYTFRAYILTFHGPEKIPHAAGHHAHESPPQMCIPMWLLSIGAVFIGGLLGHPTGIFDRFLDLTIFGTAGHHATNWTVVLWSTAAAVVGIGGAVAVYGRPSALPAKLAQLGGPFTRLSQNKFYMDEVFTLLVVWPVHGFALICRFLDNVFLDRGLVDGISKIPAWLGRLSTPMQNGLVQFYALAMMAAMVMLMWGLFWRQG